MRWSARDNVNYMMTGVVSSLSYTADNGELLLRNFYRKGVNNLERGRTQTPHAFVIPKDQRDPRRAAYLINQLQRQAIEVHQRMSGDSAGDYVVLLNQPYRNLAVTLLTTQDFPEDAEHPPYDDIAWTLGYLYGVEVNAVDDSAVFRWRGLDLLEDTVAYTGTLAGSGSIHLIENRAQDEILPALYWLRERAPGARAFAAEAQFDAGTATDGEDNGSTAATFEAGTVILEGVDTETAQQLTQQFGLDVRATAAAPEVARHELDLPRVAIYHTWFSTQDEGWARFTLEQLAIPYTSIDKDDLRAGDLLNRFDVILVPSVGGSVEQLIHGIDSKLGPMPFTKTAEYPSHGTPDATDDMTGGPGFIGLDHLQRFVEGGGVLVTLANATALAAETGITRVLSRHAANGLFHPGSVVRAKARRPDHPILYGFPEQPHVFRGNGSLYS
ncbi:MAG: M14 family zinc carboxypeptidase, partial [Longimicrobiales bacterium]